MHHYSVPVNDFVPNLELKVAIVYLTGSGKFSCSFILDNATT